jgi:twitching motility protein PilJ
MKAMLDVKLLGSSNWIKFLSFITMCAVWAMVGVFVQVGKQAGIDQTNLAEIGEQQVLSQRIAKYALAASGGEADAFIQLASSKNRFANILGAQRNEFLALTGTGSDSLTVAFSKFESNWNSFNHRVDEILDGQALVLAVVEAADLMNEVMPQLLENSEDIVDILVKSGAGNAQISLASRQSVLSQRIVNNINNVMTGDNAEAAAVAFAEDTSEFGRVLLGMIHGRSGIQAVKDSAAQAKLRKIAVLFSRVSDHVGAIVDNSEKLIGIQAAVKEVSARSEQLFNAAENVKESYISMADSRLISEKLAYLLGAIALMTLFGIGLEILRGQRRHSKEVEDENARNQEAIMRLLDEMGDLAEGDLTVRATVSEDFTGSIADSINVTVDSLRGLVKTINDTSRQISASVHETEEIAEQLALASEAQSSDITTASQAINAMSESMNEVSDEASESSKVAMQSVQIAKKGGVAVKRTMDGMDTIREHIQETSKRIKRLGESSQEIGDIVELINDIAEQTNILALNASIQAAMAGEAGRGFAVVADEVQRLAERSANATKQIEALVKTIQADTNEAVISMEKSTTGVVNGAQVAEDAGGALEEIENVSEQLAGLIQTISVSARQQAGAAAEMSTTMKGIQDVTTQMAAGTGKTSGSIGNLSRLAQDLDKSVTGFKLPE